MKTFLITLLAVLLALFIKDRIDLYLIENQGEISFARVQAYLLDFLNDGESRLHTEKTRSASSAQASLPSAQVHRSSDKEQAWRDWYAAIAPKECLKPVLREDFVTCTDIRIRARRAFEDSWQ